MYLFNLILSSCLFAENRSCTENCRSCYGDNENISVFLNCWINISALFIDTINILCYNNYEFISKRSRCTAAAKNGSFCTIVYEDNNYWRRPCRTYRSVWNSRQDWWAYCWNIWKQRPHRRYLADCSIQKLPYGSRRSQIFLQDRPRERNVGRNTPRSGRAVTLWQAARLYAHPYKGRRRALPA